MNRNENEVDLDAAMEAIRAELAKRRRRHPVGAAWIEAHGRPDSNTAKEPDWAALYGLLAQMDHQADLGANLPDLRELPPAKRLITRFATGLILRLGAVIRTKQTGFNRTSLSVLRETVSLLQQTADSALKQSGLLHAQVTALEERNILLEKRLASIEGGAGRWYEIDQELQRLKTRLANQESLLSVNNETSHTKRSRGSTESAVVRTSDLSPLIDLLSVDLMNDTRGTAEDVKRRLTIHLDHLESAGVGRKDSPILDVGCGRGEWLELLRAKGWKARGIDLNPILVKQCLELGLQVQQDDALSALDKTSSNSLGVLTAFHLLEHLPFADLLAFMNAGLRALRPGGLIIAETPNPDNLVVAARNFWMDPSHEHPLPSPFLKALAQQRGFTNVQIVNLHPVEDGRDFGEHIPQSIQQYFYGPQDYALIARKPG